MAAVVALTQSVYAGTLDDVLGLYGTSTNIADADRVRTELDRANAAYRAVRGDLSKDEYFMLMGEIAKENVSNLVCDVGTSEKYLVSLVDVGAGLDMIFDAEAEYRKALAESGQVRKAFDLSEFELSGVTVEDVRKANAELTSLKEKSPNA
ncbi:hypothetical protein AGMMS49975_29990 [Clostridia bacterium]|nr:hypothetical protein AGMMS49975_29990 [Clostridia bacterium]